MVVARNIDVDGDVDAGSDDLVIFQGNRGTRGARFFSPTKPIVTQKRLFSIVTLKRLLIKLRHTGV